MSDRRGSGRAVADPNDLTADEHAAIAAELAVKQDTPRAELLAPFGLSEPEWEAASAAFNRKLVAEIRQRAGSGGPLEERYPLSSAYAKAYAQAVKTVKDELAREAARDDEATVRIAPGAGDEPLSLLSASNRAART